jgi:hypothetical protein
MNCVAGPARKLEPSAKDKNKLQDLCASNSSSSSESDRVVTEAFELILKDQYGNDAIFPENSTVTCRLSRLSSDQTGLPSRKTPQLVHPSGSIGLDYLTSSPANQYKQLFPKIQLSPSDESVGGDGLIEVIFELQSSEGRNIENFTFTFQFTNDESRVLRERRLRDEIAPLTQRLEFLQGRQHECDQERDCVKQQLLEVSRAGGLSANSFTSLSDVSIYY